jgi:hypothetical protein
MTSVQGVLDAASKLGLVAVIIAFIRVLGWLAGLVIVLRGCPPADRAKVLRAYGASQPRPGRRSNANSVEENHDRHSDDIGP